MTRSAAIRSQGGPTAGSAPVAAAPAGVPPRARPPTAPQRRSASDPGDAARERGPGRPSARTARKRGCGRPPGPSPAPRWRRCCARSGRPRDAAPHPRRARGPAGAVRPPAAPAARRSGAVGAAETARPTLSPIRAGRASPSCSSTTTRRRAQAAVAELQHADMPVRAFDDGNKALSAIAEEKPDVIVLELASAATWAARTSST